MTDKRSNTGQLVGWFWSAEEAEKKLPGTLRIASSGAMTLELINHPSALDRPSRSLHMPVRGIPRPWYLSGTDQQLAGLVSGNTVSGRTVQEKEIALEGCHLLTIGQLQQPKQIKFIVNSAYIGVSTPPTDDLLCQGVGCRAEGVEGWLNPGGPSLRDDEDASHPPGVEVSAQVEGLGEVSVKLRTLRGWSRAKGNSFELSESGFFSLKPDEPASWSSLRRCVNSVQRFLRFALNSRCQLKQVLLEVDGDSIEVVDRDMRDGDEDPYRPGSVASNALFTADEREVEVVGFPSDVLRRWLELPINARGTLLRLHGLMIGSEFVDTQAVSACSAGELWCKHILGENNEECRAVVVLPEAVDPLSEDVREAVESLFRESGWWDVYDRRIKSVLNGPNDVSTTNMVRMAFDPIEREVMQLEVDATCEVSRGLLNLRHPLSHGDVALDMGIEGTAKLVRKARAILKLRVLEYLGVDWRAVVRYNKTIRWELGLGGTDWHALPYPCTADSADSPEDEDAAS